jgi:tRNA G10  N-methylase Trm11
MNTYAFILGRETKLSLAEISQVLTSEEIHFNLISYSNEVALISADLITPELFYRLGGSIKFAQVQQLSEKSLDAYFTETIQERLTENKFHVGLSIYSGDKSVSQQQLREKVKEVRRQIFTIKTELKEAGNSFRYVESKDLQLSSVVVRKNHLIDKRGVEFMIIEMPNELWVGPTLAVQDFEAFAQRDHARPFRDDRSGMLPPKLARTMLNLTGKVIDEEVTVLDPFCGSGTVLQEAALLGARKVLGSDLNKRAVMDSLGNLSWLKQQHELKTDIRVEQVDVAELTTWLPENFVDIIVTEPYLGAPVNGKLLKQEINERHDALSRLYDEALVQYHKVLKPGGIVVMIFPFIQNSRLPIPRHFFRLFDQIDLGKNVTSGNRKGIDYQRPSQRVGREIMLLRKPE